MNTILPVGSTPTFTFHFCKIPVEMITVAYLTIQQNSQTIVEKTIEDMEFSVDKQTISWTLTQEDTLNFYKNSPTQIQIRYKTSDGFVGHSRVYEIKSDEILKNGAI